MFISQNNAMIAVTKVQDILVVTMQADLDSNHFEAMCHDILEQMRHQKVEAVVVDFSAVDVMSLSEFDRLRRFFDTVHLLKAQPAIVSLSAGVVLYLVEAGAHTEGIHFFFGLDEALQKFQKA
ncbi:STAS domain-containing protein [Magnetococcus sp. PR-3]|uniref:STAS domain-containing protein n=1 Tax=Magnetococcus sp. PR-3 TaxID=3120355 RepID=UPI002FCE3BC7